MKKVVQIYILLYIVLLLTLLSGCSGSPIEDRVEIERLRPIQTMGFDKSGEGMTISVSSGPGQEGQQALVMKTTASGIETAIERLQDYSPKDELYFAHVEYILLGESIAQDDAVSVLDWVERSPAMRMDTSLYIVKGSAEEAIVSASNSTTDVTERFASLEREEQKRGQTIYSLREVVTALLENNCALCLAVESPSSQGTMAGASEEADTSAIVPAGYAVLKDGVLADYLSESESFAADLLAGSGGIGSRIPVDDSSLILLKCSSDVSGQWSEDGTLTGILINAHLQAGVLELENVSRDDKKHSDLEERFAQTIAAWMCSVVTHAQACDCDFLGLKDGVMGSAPKNSAITPEDWNDVFPNLTVTVQTQAEITREYDLAA